MLAYEGGIQLSGKPPPLERATFQDERPVNVILLGLTVRGTAGKTSSSNFWGVINSFQKSPQQQGPPGRPRAEAVLVRAHSLGYCLKSAYTLPLSIVNIFNLNGNEQTKQFGF